MSSRLKKHWLFSVCFLILLGNMLFYDNANKPSDVNCRIQQSDELCSIQPQKETSALANTTVTTAVPQVINLRTQPQFRLQTSGKHFVQHGLHPKNTAKPRQANKVTTTFCRKNTKPVEYFIYFLQEIII